MKDCEFLAGRKQRYALIGFYGKRLSRIDKVCLGSIDPGRNVEATPSMFL